MPTENILLPTSVARYWKVNYDIDRTASMFGKQLHGCVTYGRHRISAREATADVDYETVVVSCTHIQFRLFRR